MDESFKEVLKNFQLPQRGMEDVKAVMLIVLSLVVLVMVIYLIHSAAFRKKGRKVIRKSALTRGLTQQELLIILKAVDARPRIDPMKVLNSLREFQRLFGPLMHDLVERMETDPSARYQLNQIFALRKKLFGEVAYHFGPLSTTLQLPIGQRLTLKFDYHGKSTTATTIVLDVDSAAITVANPSREGQHLRLARDLPVNVLLYRVGDAEYQFNTSVIRSTEPGTQPFLLLAHDLNIQRIQTREFYRLSTRISFNFRRFAWDSQLDNRYLQKEEEKVEEYQGQIHNISAGGMMFTTEAKLDKNDILVFSLQLSPEMTMADLLGKVLNISSLPEREEKFLVHLRFVNIRGKEQDQIIRMILQKKIQDTEEQ
ncbi:MAG: PilZ domain-containing protein [Candidatus Glassbacteria bacterium]|nr:PilZ domain-containing protein [Candidatus Glassbacteria bacterium]